MNSTLATDSVIGGAIGGALTVAGQGLVTAAGFTSSGVAAGSLAAGAQGATVAAGSAFATLQSIGATGAILSLGPAAVVGGAALGAVYYFANWFIYENIFLKSHLCLEIYHKSFILCLENCQVLIFSMIKLFSMLINYISELKVF